MTNQINNSKNGRLLVWCVYICTLSIVFTSCQKIQDRFNNKPQYNIELYKDSLYITIPWYEPITYSSVAYPSNFNIDEVLKTAFSILKRSPNNGDIKIYVSLYCNKSDKYGNLYREYSLFNLMEVDIKEVKKYHSYVYFENEYDIEGKIRVLHNNKPLRIINKLIK